MNSRRLAAALVSMLVLSLFLVLPAQAKNTGKAKMPFSLSGLAKMEAAAKSNGNGKARAPFGLKSMVAFISQVNVSDQSLGLRNSSRFNVDARNAVVIRVGEEEGASVVALGDLQVDAKAYLLVRKQRGDDGRLRAVLIVQPIPSAKESPLSESNKPVAQFSSATSTSAEGSSTVSIGVVLSKPSDRDVRVKYRVIGGSATSGGVDFSLVSSGEFELVIPAGQSSADIVMNVVDDSLDESDETVVLKLYDARDVSLGTHPVHTHTMLDND